MKDDARTVHTRLDSGARFFYFGQVAGVSQRREFFNDAISAYAGRARARNEFLKMPGRAMLTNEFRRGYSQSVSGPVPRFEVLSSAGNQPAWQMSAKTSTSGVSPVVHLMRLLVPLALSISRRNAVRC
jgi:hypothetical protein